MAGTPVLERLTASDLFLLMWDDYGWSSDIGGLAVCDGTRLLDPDCQVRIEAIREQLEPRLHLVPRFRQLLYRPRPGLGWPLWVDAPRFDLADHIRVHPLAAPAGESQLLQACQELARRRLDPARPLWELGLLPGLPNRRVGAYLRLHHAVADGAAALAAFGALLDQACDAPAPAEPSWTPAPIPTASELLRDNLRRRGHELGRGWSGLTHPGQTLARARAAWPAWREVLAEQPAPRTSLNYPVGPGRRPAGAAVPGRRAAAGAVPHDAGHGQPDPRRRRAVLCRAAQPHRRRRPRPLPGPGGIHPRRAHRPRRPRTIGACARPSSGRFAAMPSPHGRVSRHR